MADTHRTPCNVFLCIHSEDELLSGYLHELHEAGPPWEDDSRSAGQEVPSLINPKVHYRVHKRPPLFLRQFNPPTRRTLILSFILSSVPSEHFHACQMPRPSFMTTMTYGEVRHNLQITNLHIMRAVYSNFLSLPLNATDQVPRPQTTDKVTVHVQGDY
jgi:hypothetical protein